MNATFGALSANPQQFLQNFQSSPLAAWGLPMAGLAGMVNPQAGNTALSQLGYGQGALSGGNTLSGGSTLAGAPSLSDTASLGQQLQSGQQPIQSASQQQDSHWEQLISLLMQRIGMTGFGGGGNNLFGSSGNPNSGFIPTFNVSGIYSR